MTRQGKNIDDLDESDLTAMGYIDKPVQAGRSGLYPILEDQEFQEQRQEPKSAFEKLVEANSPEKALIPVDQKLMSDQTTLPYRLDLKNIFKKL
jgi:hypothetical protein